MLNKTNTTFLIVDDFKAMQQIIKDNLINRGYSKFFLANNGKEALSILNTNKVDLVIADWNMPVMTGLELLNSMRQVEKLANIPLLMVTAETKKQHINQAIDSGINEFMVKPFTSTTLYEKIDSIFAGRSPIQQPRDWEEDSAYKPVFKHKDNDKTELIIDSADNIKAKILVVDDVASNNLIVSRYLGDNYQTRTATNGQEAIEITVSDSPPDLIFLDIEMPGMSGLEVCQQLKANPLTVNIPVIFISANTDQETLVKGFKSGAVDFISKPVIASELQVRVQNHLDLKSSQEELKEQVDTLMEVAHLRDDIERMSRHDLKTPISAIINLSSEVNNQDRINIMGEKFVHQIKQIESSAFLLMDMVNQSLNIYKVEAGKYKFSPKKIDIKTVLEKVTNDLSILADINEVGLRQLYEPVPSYCMVEELLCYSIFSNIIKNAIEASEPSDIVRIDIKTNADKVMIRIHNTKEVPASILNNFFEKYSSAEKDQGTGLGTYSAKLLTEVQQGSIAMTSDSLTGTVITMSFNAAE